MREAGGECLVLELFESFRSYQEILDVRPGRSSPGSTPSPSARCRSRRRSGSRRRTPGRACPRRAHVPHRQEARRGRLRRRRDSRGAGGRPCACSRTDPRDLPPGLGSLRDPPAQGSARLARRAARARDPVSDLRGSGFYDRREILDLLAYLQVVANPYDGLALIRVLQQPPFGLSDRSLYRLANLELVGSEGEALEVDAHENTVVPGFRLKPFDAVRRALDEPELARSWGSRPRR
ncbi:MAG: 3'-5' exonuclease [Planctomycetota bacterium]